MTQRPRATLPAHLAVWLTVPCVEWVVSRSVPPGHAPWQIAVEFAAFGTLGALQWRLATEPWVQTLLWPGLLLMLGGIGLAGPSMKLLWLVFYVMGLVLLTTSILRDLGGRVLVGPVLGILLAAGGVLGARALDLRTGAGNRDASFGGSGGGVAGRLLEELRGNEPLPLPTTDGPPVVVISIDTLRADAGATMEIHRRLAARGAAWTSAMSTSSWTMPAVASLQTGKTPAEHGAACMPGSVVPEAALSPRGKCQGLSDRVRTLAEDLRDAGYVTAAVTANPWITTSTGLHRGFQTFVDLAGVPPFRLLVAGLPDVPHPQDGRVVIDEALDWLAEAPDHGFYLWVHLLGPHMPYLRAENPALRSLDGPMLRNGGAVTAEFAAKVREAYDGEVRYNDREVGRLLDALEAKGVLERGIIVLTADHGEEFWEHGGVEHGHSHHAEVIEVPLVLVGPGVAPGTRTDTASLVDVASTVRAIVGLPAAGVDLREPAPHERIVTAWGNLYQHFQRSARDGASRAIVTEGVAGTPIRSERFDRIGDPDEHHPLIDATPHPVTMAALDARGPGEGAAASLDLEALRALGYVQ